MEFEVLASGSKGNAVVLEKHILIDCGVPYKMLLPWVSKLKLVLLTHIHTDHANKSTIKRLASERPRLRFGCGDWMAPLLIEAGVKHKNIDICNVFEPGTKIKYKGFDIELVPLVHNVPNCGYKIQFENGETLFYATDTKNLDGVTAKNFDVYMIEANYGREEILERIRRKEAKGEYCHEYAAMENHMSREDAEKWIANNAGEKSKVIYMHQHEERSTT